MTGRMFTYNYVECANCGAKMPIGAKFCGLCGSHIKRPIEKGFTIWELRDSHPSFFVECPNCGAKMPVDASFCGFCGSPLPKRALEGKKWLPIWELFEPGTYIEYIGENEKVKYEVLAIKNEVMEFLEERHTMKGVYKHYFYVSKDRRYWFPQGHNKNFLLKSRCSFEDLAPYDDFTTLWIDARKINVGDIIPLSDQKAFVISTKSENGRNFYIVDRVLNLPSYYNTIIHSHYYHDIKTGLLWKIVHPIDNYVSMHLSSAWRNL